MNIFNKHIAVQKLKALLMRTIPDKYTEFTFSLDLQTSYTNLNPEMFTAPGTPVMSNTCACVSLASLDSFSEN